MDRRFIVASAALLAWAGSPAQAQLYKCKGPDGKIVYSDQRCESKDTPASVAPGVSNRAHAIEEKAAAERAAAARDAEKARLDAEARVAAEIKAGRTYAPPPPAAPAAPPPAAPRGPYQPTAGDEARIRDLEVDLGRMGASSEQRTAAQLEISSIRSGREARLTSEQRSRRESLTADLSSADAAKRRDALRELRSLYNR